ncbi:Rab GTP exchange factor [Acrasis kona]|uniref:Rab GTP exchange factor n=1 Tax=Acrasis kona TaxID=1008807 RepID=A0AAW2ZP01_9EUKA
MFCNRMFVDKKLRSNDTYQSKMKDQEGQPKAPHNIQYELARKKKDEFFNANRSLKVGAIDMLTSTLPMDRPSLFQPEEDDIVVSLENALLPPFLYDIFLTAVHQQEKQTDLLLITSGVDRKNAVDIVTRRYESLFDNYKDIFRETDVDSEHVILGRCIEKYMFEETNLFEYIFIECDQDRRTNEDISARLRSFSFLEPHHLGLPDNITENEMWSRSLRLMRGINTSRTLFGKIAVMQEALKSLFHTGLFPLEEMCTDLFLSAIIFMLSRANPKHLHSNVNFIMKYGMDTSLYQHCLINETGFLFTNLQCGYMFWKDLDFSDMNQVFQHLESDKQRQIRAKMNMWRHYRSESLAETDIGNKIVSWEYVNFESKKDT